MPAQAAHAVDHATRRLKKVRNQRQLQNKANYDIQPDLESKYKLWAKNKIYRSWRNTRDSTLKTRALSRFRADLLHKLRSSQKHIMIGLALRQQETFQHRTAHRLGCILHCLSMPNVMLEINMHEKEVLASASRQTSNERHQPAAGVDAPRSERKENTLKLFTEILLLLCGLVCRGDVSPLPRTSVRPCLRYCAHRSHHAVPAH